MEYCYNCRSRNTVENGTILYFQKSGAEPLFVENLPAGVCRLCGPRYYPGKVLTTLDNQVRGGRGTPIAHHRVPVFDLKNPDAKPEKAKAAATVPTLAEVPGD